MSSSTSSSLSSQSPRPPLQERSEAEKNKLQIRIVPYSPPRPGDGEDSSKSHAQDQETGDVQNNPSTANDREVITTPQRRRATSYGTDEYGAESQSSSPVFSTPASPLERIKGKGVSGTKLASDSSGLGRTAPPSPVDRSYSRSVNVQPEPSSSRHDDRSASSTWKRPSSRRETFINVHADKTFSVVLKSTRQRQSDRSESTNATSIHPSNTSIVSSHEESSFVASTEDRHGSPLSSVPERSVSPYTSIAPSTATAVPEDQDTESSSPWNYRMVGGLRKVPKTPDIKGKGKARELSESPLPSLPPLPRTIVTPPQQPSSPLAAKPSFASVQTDSTIEETTNYKIIGRSSPPLPDTESFEESPSSSSSNIKLLGQSSPAQTVASSAAAPGYADTPGSKNYIVYGDTSPLSSSATPFRGHYYHSSDESSIRQLREKYSQESLVVPPLRPHKRSSSEDLGYHKLSSKENLRGRANSFSSLSSIVSQDTASLFGGNTPNVVRLAHTPSTSSIPRSTWVGTASIPQQPRVRMDIHQWSSQLSTVMSEYEGSDPGSQLASQSGSHPGSRIASIGSIPERVSSAFGSRDSRHMRSISSSLGLENIDVRRSHSRSHSRSNSQGDSVERPGPAYARNGQPSPLIRTVRDHDEHGDGLADLHQLDHKPSRTRLGFSRQASDRSLRSSGSSRAGSLTASSLPTWARLYYGSGERRWLAPASIRSMSDAGDSYPSSPWIGGGGSPAHDQTIYNPRRRPMDIDLRGQRRGSMDIEPVGETGDIRLAPRKKTSSIWSPHLRLDTRASGFSAWNAPSVTWSADSGVFGRRNIQVLLFVAGFLFPFAWMIAAFLPLPPKPTLAMDERDRSTTEFASESGEPPRGQHVLIDDSRYQSARWWRNVNRFMAVAGLLILGAVAALIVIGVRQKWAQ
ncbi:uncharacterized protein GGS22DRAFT_31223 [Annulohypoxylon maeteangense]|uniref:uncharacterized protein n=1 Tax=Annulohypoxylon maeteangense TaxID=1927788 RepID=UPI0020076C19|nr:uncharacterized protein GGS22DRAFT_31223 [Annulohypoxylon maeteangense]KAI0883474.1 hypothetical protein GGS22DRAFT_31223 [Annulohypoxylon maeteangense]